ncbi:MAG: hypothetical protein JRI56_11990 [Deltaproteobacteria bacterium]|nr:hypothetical protein [Deltaproteobacteria bacterium]
MQRGFVEVNFEDASKEGIQDKDIVTLETRRGSIETEAKVTDEVPPGLLFVPIHFSESLANVLTIPALDPSAKCAETKVCAARLKAKINRDRTENESKLEF